MQQEPIFTASNDYSSHHWRDHFSLDHDSDNILHGQICSVSKFGKRGQRKEIGDDKFDMKFWYWFKQVFKIISITQNNCIFSKCLFMKGILNVNLLSIVWLQIWVYRNIIILYYNELSSKVFGIMSYFYSLHFTPILCICIINE